MFVHMVLRLPAELVMDSVNLGLPQTHTFSTMPMTARSRRYRLKQLRTAKQARNTNTKPASPTIVPKDSLSPGKRKRDSVSRSSSSLSEASQLQSPATAAPPPDRGPPRVSPSTSASTDDAHQPPPAASIAQYQTFGPNPVDFDDPTCYEILPVQDDMTDEEKKEIYCVSTFPHDDLHELIAGTPPNKDFSNAVKPSNQVSAHTFNLYLENYLRPLKEEDIGFLNERVSIHNLGIGFF